MKERPILFSGPMVLKIMTCAKCGHVGVPIPCEKCGSEDFVKTQTRRVVKPQPGPSAQMLFDPHEDRWYANGLVADCKDIPSKCPYGVPGDRLWVKENCWIAPKRFGDPDLNNCKDNDGDGRVVGYSASMDGDSVRCAKDYGVKQTPSIFMPRWASRLTLEVTGVRVERLKEISTKDAIAEGCSEEFRIEAPSCPRIGHDCKGWHYGATWEYFLLWDSINGKKHPWASNPWVWVISFTKGISNENSVKTKEQ